nr:YabP/YqfC family sporulation protein [uncultured Ruminococcus sp.]
MPENMIKKPHLLTLENRSLLTLTGVEDVSGFDEQTISIRTADSNLVVKGSSLHISRLSLDTGDVVIDGQINSLQYLSSTSGSLRSRLFR